MKKNILIGIAGGSGSGKTTVALKIKEKVGEDILILDMDSYYKDHSHIPFEERVKINYDHPDAFDFPLLINHLKRLIQGKSIEKPVYSFVKYVRLKETQRIEPKKIIIIEGILSLFDEELRNLMDIKIYVDTDPDVRFIRRLLRDIKERGRSLDSVVTQYLEIVRPMHIQFVEPTKRFADVIIPEGGFNIVAVDMIVGRIKELLKEIK
ncbi:MAG TPA: uridine kinase [Firmicutes bacterium]|nr:uridine kinase [Caldisericia bacterium]HDJ99865.1 uridine kinase [Bacillota bacterium]